MVERQAAPGFYLFGFVRAVESWEILRRKDTEGLGLQRVAYRDVAAVVAPMEFGHVEVAEETILTHHRVNDETMRRETVLPAPVGVVFRDRKAVLRLLREQHHLIDRGLALVEGHWEVRIQMDATGAEPAGIERGELARRAFAELKESARASTPFEVAEDTVFGAAFLVERDRLSSFVERAEALESSLDGELAFDITWPWPPYDFIRLTD
ncbi:MAG: GvpL/GvpF family gas vesicle protein [Gemmatimonadota bacterium]